MILKEETVKLFLNKHFQGEKTKISSEALTAFTKLMELFIQEAIERSSQQADIESMEHVDIDHLEKILPQLLLDF